MRAVVRTGDLASKDLCLCVSGGSVAIDTETSGLDWREADLLLVQVYVPSAEVTFLVRYPHRAAPRLRHVLELASVDKIFHHARFDLRFLQQHLEVEATSVHCTKVLSRIINGGTPPPSQHSLKSLVSEHLGIQLDKTQRLSDWSAESLTDEQVMYAANDVQFLPALFDRLYEEAASMGIAHLAEAAFAFLPTRVELDFREVDDPFAY